MSIIEGFTEAAKLFRGEETKRRLFLEVLQQNLEFPYINWRSRTVELK